MSTLNNFGLTGVSNLLRFGKSNGQLLFDGTNGFRIRNAENNADATLLIATGTAANSATTKNYVETYYTSPAGISITSGTLSLNYTTLPVASTIYNTDIISISQSGTVNSTTISQIATPIPPSVTLGTIIADGTNSTFNVGYPLANYSGLTTYITRVKLVTVSAFLGNNVANAIVTDSTNTLMIASESNIGTTGSYMDELPLSFASSGNQCVINFTEIDGVTPAIPTSGTAIISVESVLNGTAGFAGYGAANVTSIAAGNGLTGGTITTSGTISLGTTGVTAGTYGSGTSVFPIITVDANGRITSASNGTLSGGGGGVTSINGTGANGVSVSGGPVTGSGVLTIGLGTITPTAISTPGDIIGSNTLSIGTPTNVVSTVGAVNVSNGFYINGVNVQYAGAAFLNRFRNPQMTVKSRIGAVSIASGTSGYTMDGWIVATTGAALSVTQGGPAIPLTVSPGYAEGGAYITVSSGTATATSIAQRIESDFCYALAGQNVTFTAYVQRFAGVAVTPTLVAKYQPTTDNVFTGLTTIGTYTLQTVSVGNGRYVSYTFPMPAAAYHGIEITLNLGTMTTVTQTTITNCDIRATPALTTGTYDGLFTPEYRPLAVEQAICARYLPVIYGGAFVLPGQCFSATTFGAAVSFTTPARANVSGLLLNGASSNFKVFNTTGGTIATSGFAIGTGGAGGAYIVGSVGAGLVAGQATLMWNTAGNATQPCLIFTGAEL